MSNVKILVIDDEQNIVGDARQVWRDDDQGPEESRYASPDASCRVYGRVHHSSTTYGQIKLIHRYPETLPEKCATWLVDLLEERDPLIFAEILDQAAREDFKRWVVVEARQLLDNLCRYILYKSLAFLIYLSRKTPSDTDRRFSLRRRAS